MSDPQIGALIGKGADAEVFEYGAHALKLFNDPANKSRAFLEAQNLTIAASHDLPVPEVFGVGQFKGRWGIVMTRVSGTSLGDTALANQFTAADMLDRMVHLQRHLHTTTEIRLRPLKPKLAAAIAIAPQLDEALKQRLTTRLGDLPDGQQPCHGDFHPYNLISEGEKLTIIDWLDLTSGPPAADACRSHVILSIFSQDLANDYLRRYADASGKTEEEILAWRPVIAAARLRENPPDVDQLVEWATGL